MINIKVTMINGKEYNVKNFAAMNVQEFIKFVFMPHGVSIPWVEILPEEFMYAPNVLNIRKLTESEIQAINKPEQLSDGVDLVDEQENEEIKDKDTKEED